jgi:hypothetical protein
LKPARREFPLAQLGEITTVHEALDAGFDDFFDNRLNDGPTIHNRLLPLISGFRVSS